MKKIIVLLFIIVYNNLFSQIGFQDHVIIDDTYSANDAHSVYSGDLDGDGDIDVLSAARSGGKISWFENVDGLGTFQQRIITTLPSTIESVYADDIDGDGDLDVLYGSYSEVAWYENIDGLGTFSVLHIISTEVQYVPSAITSDVDGDGDMDVLSASWGLDEIAWYENIDGQGTFGTKQVISSIDNGWSIFAADIDGDGDNDLLSAPGASSSRKFYWFENTDGLGSFSSENTISSSAFNPRSVYAADIDGDDDIDIVLGTEADNKVSWFENTDGLGTFVLKQELSTSVDAKSVKLADIDGDGDLDVVSASFQNDKISWFENTDGLGTFGSENIISTKANGARTVHVDDLDGDGDMDVISGSGIDDKVAWYENTDGNGTFGIQQEMTINAIRPEAVFSADIDGDGDLDAVSASSLDNKIAWYENIDGNGDFGNQHIVSTDALNVKSLYCMDVDNDGDTDIIAASSFIDQEIVWFENLNGLGVFGSKKLITTEVQTTISLYGVDLDNDGYKDLLSASSGDDKISWYKNDGNGIFSSQLIISTSGDGASYVYAADIDGDNDMDVVSSSSNDNKISWYENIDGLGTFGIENSIESDASFARAVKSFDIDGDGDMDIVTNSNYSTKWFENTDGKGNFVLRQRLLFNDMNPGTSLYGVDVDKDGDIDVVSSVSLTTSTNEAKIVWYENIDGLGTFGTRQTIYEVLQFNSTLFADIGDFDLDGDIDFLIAAYNMDKIIWNENLGVIANEINGVVTIDLDANGCDDIDPKFTNLMITTDNGIDKISTFTSNIGLYQLFPGEGDFITFINSDVPYYTSAPSSHSSNFTGIGNTDTANFCLEPIANINDVCIAVFPLAEPRPSSERFYNISYRNVGTTTIDGNIVFEFDSSKMAFDSANATVVSQTANTVTFSYTDLVPMESRGIKVLFFIFPPPTTNINDVLDFSATINPIGGDENTGNNTTNFSQTVIDSYDPNDISVIEGNKVLLADANKYLHYIIRFQNTGTAEAININIENILDSNLDLNSLQLLDLSHDGRVEIKNGNEVKFIFDGIYLPDSISDEPNSHGFITYMIKPKSGISVGDIIPNIADIYFDFNAAVTTNQVNTEIVNTLAVSDVTGKEINLYPNPTNGLLNIKSKTPINKIDIYNIQGAKIKSYSRLSVLDISLLSDGLYIIKFTNNSGSKSYKRILKK